MYLTTKEGLERGPLLYGSFAGTLGEPPLPPKIQSFLDRVKRSPQDYEALLLMSVFHVEPWISDQLFRMIGDTFVDTDSKPFDDAEARRDRVVQVLQSIQKKHLRHKHFGELVKKEKELIPVVANAFQKRIKELDTKGWLEGVLTDALLAEYPSGLTAQVGRRFVLFNLPDEIAEQILNSRVPETHYARLGKALRLMAEQRQQSNDAFKQRVEQERKKQGK